MNGHNTTHWGHGLGVIVFGAATIVGHFFGDNPPEPAPAVASQATTRRIEDLCPYHVTIRYSMHGGWLDGRQYDERFALEHPVPIAEIEPLIRDTLAGYKRVGSMTSMRPGTIFVAMKPEKQDAR